MDRLYIVATDQAPDILFDIESDIYSIKGRSISPDDSHFHRIEKWIDDNIDNLPSKITIEISLEFFNITSSKKMLHIFHKLDEIKSTKIEIDWLCVDEDMFEIGEDYAFMVNNIKFNISMVQN
jgi:hypothetical protein